MGDGLHLIRRWWWRTFKTRHHWKPDLCTGCGNPLTEQEAHYYGHTCERCEGIAFDAQERVDRVKGTPE